MRYRPCVALVLLTFLFSAEPALAAFDGPTLRCRASVVKSATKMLSSTLKSFAACAKERAADASFSDTDCTDLEQTDLDSKVADAEEKFLDKIAGEKSKCTGILPVNALYAQCPAPCNDEVPAVSTWADVGDCIICLERANLETLADTAFGQPVSPLPADDGRCQFVIAKTAAQLVFSAVKDVTRCELSSERAGGTSILFCTDTGFPSEKVVERQADAAARISDACAGSNFGNLDTCDMTAPGAGACITAAGLVAAQPVATQFLALSTLCGDGEIQSPEQCDDAGESADCDDDCTFVVCGDHVINETAGEDCDGNTQCCNECQFVTAGTPCNDGSICTDPDACNGAGSCVGAAAPDLSCSGAAAGGSRLTLKNKKKNTKDQLKWTWGKGIPVPTVDDFGDPIANGYTLCVYRNTDDTPLTFRSIRFLSGSRRWKNDDDKKLKFSDKSRYPDGATYAKLKPGLLDKARIKVKIAGRRLGFSNLTTQFIPSVELQFRNSTSQCFSSTFNGPFTDPVKFSSKNQ